MTSVAITLRRNRSIQAGIAGAIFGAMVTIGGVFAFTNLVTLTSDAASESIVGPAPDVQAVLQEHLAREYGTTGTTLSGLEVQDALREHLAREYGITGTRRSGVDVQDALREHQAREYRDESHLGPGR